MFGANLRQKFLKNRIIMSCLLAIMLICTGYFIAYHKRMVSLSPYDDRVMSMQQKEVSPSASAGKIKLMKYLNDIYGKKILSGQHVSENSPEVEAVHEITGKKPAILEFDLMDFSPSRVERGADGIDMEQVIQWGCDGGIVAFCWHWNAPMGLIDRRPDKQWYRGFYTDATTFNFKKGIQDIESKEYQLMIRDIDAIAQELKKLQEKGIPVLWRPLHEASGGWFWWGSQGPEPYKALWRMMFERLTEHHRLDNLIWVWNGEHPEWYPGDDVVDIVGMDFYGAKRDYSPREELFKTAETYADEYKMVAFTETGVIPDPDLLQETGAKWLWYCTWSEELVLKEDQKTYSEEYTEVWMLKKVYQHEYVITRDELPQFR